MTHKENTNAKYGLGTFSSSSGEFDSYKLTLTFKKGQMIAHIQSEIEAIAIQTMGDSRGIYQQPIKLSPLASLIWDEKLKGWVFI